MIAFDDESIVRSARERLLACAYDPYLPPYGARWQAYVERIRNEIARLKRPEDVLHYAQTSIGFEHRGNIYHEGKFTALYERELYAEFPQFAGQVDRFADIEGAAPDTTYQHKGRLVSNVLFYLTRIVLRCLAHVPATNIILEIGGGYGAPARLWMRNPIRAPQCYIILDIPESLFFADVFLRAELGNSSVYYVETDASIDIGILDHYKIVLCPLAHHTALYQLPIDLVINTGSMQEMSEEWVNFYGGFLDRQQGRWFYSLNYFGQPIAYLAESVNLWSPRVGSRWTARVLRWNPAFIRMQSERNYLEAIYERDAQPAPSREQALELARFLDSRQMTGEVWVEYVDLVRRTALPEVALGAVRRAMREMPYRPKEAAYWVDWLLESADQEPLGSHILVELKEYRATLQEERRKGIEAIY
jgi:putative sugar O-methyltransferase